MGGKLSIDDHISEDAFLQQVASSSSSSNYDSPLFWSEGFASLADLHIILLDAEQLQLALLPFLQNICMCASPPMIVPK